MTMESKLRSYCESDSLSEEGLRAIIIYEHLTPNNHNRLGNYGFFCEACRNERVTVGIIQCLLEYFPHAASSTDRDEWSPLHFACCNKNVTLNLVQLLVDAAPASVRSVNNYVNMPLDLLCMNEKVNEATAVEILKFLIDKYPEAVRHADNVGFLPIHYASTLRSPEFCRLLIEAYPGSEQINTTDGNLPLHRACTKNSPATVEYLYQQYPEAIHHVDNRGRYPVHVAIRSIQHRDNPAVAVKVVQFLLDCNPDQKLIQFQGASLLQYACQQWYYDSKIEAGVQLIKILFDAHPEAIEDDNIAIAPIFNHQHVQEFINGELVYARQARDQRLMTTADDNGQLPLHRALQNNVTLGSIKLLVKGNSDALQSPDSSGALPLHVACEHSLAAIKLLAEGNRAAVLSRDNSGRLPLHVACQHHNSTDDIEYLVELDQSTLDAIDQEGNTALHLACQNAKHDTITLLLEKFGAISVSTRNADKKLPIDLLWESNAVVDRESIEYTVSIYQLLRANPEMITGIDVQQAMQSSASVSTVHCQTGKKRKLGQ